MPKGARGEKRRGDEPLIGVPRMAKAEQQYLKLQNRESR